MGTQASQKTATWGLIMMPAPAARPPHASGTRVSPVSQLRATPQAASTRSRASKKSRWPARQAPPAR